METHKCFPFLRNRGWICQRNTWINKSTIDWAAAALMSASLMGWKWLPYFYFCLAISFCHLVWHLKEKGWFHSKARCMWGVSYTFALCYLWSVTPAEKFSFKVQFSSPPFPLGEQEIPAGPGEHLAGCYPEFFHYITIVKMSPLLAQPCRGKQTSSALSCTNASLNPGLP